MGLESGDEATLKNVRKGVSVQTMVEMGRMVIEAGIKLSVTVLLGLAGPERSEVHAQAIGRALSAMDPDYVGALSLMLLPNRLSHIKFHKAEEAVLEYADDR